MKKITVSHKDAGRRTDRFLQKALPGAGLSFICRMLRKKNITVNGHKADPSLRLEEGDEIGLFFSDETYDKLLTPDRSGIKAAGAGADPGADDEAAAGRRSGQPDVSQYVRAYERIGHIDTIYEDDDFLIVDKPAGVLSQKSSASDISMNEWIVGYMIDKGELTAEDLITFRPAFANRLDRNTSGIMPGGKSLRALQFLNRAIREENIGKYYLCRALGHPDERFGVGTDGFTEFDGYLIKDADANRVKICGSMEETDAGAKKIRTGFRLIRTEDELDESMLLEVELHTGKSHQIRAMLSSLGHPIAQDAKYGGAVAGRSGRYRPGSGNGTGAGKRADRQQLHAYRLVFCENDEFPSISGREFKTRLPWFMSGE